MYIDTGSSNTYSEIELRRLRCNYEDLGASVRRLALILGVPLRFYLVSNEHTMPLLFSEGDFTLCNFEEGEVSTCNCGEELNGWLYLAYKLDEPAVVKCKKGSLLGFVKIKVSEIEERDGVMVVGPIWSGNDSIFESSPKICPISVSERDTLSKCGRIDWGERLIWIKEFFESLVSKHNGIEDGGKYKRKENGNRVLPLRRRDASKDYLHLPFDEFRGDFLWVGMIFRNSELLRMVLSGKGEELWNFSIGKVEAINLLCAWVEGVIFKRMLEERLVGVSDVKAFDMRSHIGDSEDVSLKTIITKITRRLLSNFRKIDYGLKREDCERFAFVVNRLKEILWMNPHLVEMVEGLGINDSALSHWLRRKAKFSFEELKTYFQIEICAKYLRDSKMGLGNIGRRIGIGLESQLSMKFKRYMGLYPTEYRRLFSNYRIISEKELSL